MLWISTLAKARSAAPISAAISAKRATQVSAKIKATLPDARQKGSWRRRSLVTAQYGDAPHSLLAIWPSASTRDPLQYFNSLLKSYSGFDAEDQSVGDAIEPVGLYHVLKVRPKVEIRGDLNLMIDLNVGFIRL